MSFTSGYLSVTEFKNKQNKDNVNADFFHINSSLIHEHQYAIFWAFSYPCYLSITCKLDRFFQKFSFALSQP